MIAPAAPSVSSTLWEPSFHVRCSTCEAPGSTAVTAFWVPKALPKPARTPTTAVACGSFRTASAEETSVGMKPFCEVSA